MIGSEDQDEKQGKVDSAIAEYLEAVDPKLVRTCSSDCWVQAAWGRFMKHRIRLEIW